ncbi:MAG: phosphoglycerate kinase [Candidatus Sungbacteria bacterium RIFCSPLOWO2_01_FULL_60_25]|uniref:Phosphoglycerate kinase n=1 Tax=Candidatus Sungbacteria bacterium RIFCSPLOWO2_01_FULL_60_25 TaxID=1802281 RepID=A0A1G2LED1_9BACT|nr:MAG: phosphoglycerate kinase [Candidatus Sungbacteria bacterium RIFCSPLOWO2_01_FULL_60_25]
MVKALSRYPLRKRRVLLRVDFNVPVAHGRVAGDFRIRAHLPTIRALRQRGNQVILLSHHSNHRQSIRPVARHLVRLLGAPVAFLADPEKARAPLRGPIVLLENLRFWKGEEAEDGRFARILASLGDAFVNDAFAVAHRRGASITVLPRIMPAYLGPLFEREIAELKRLEKNPERPLVAVFGGAKIETKIKLLRRMARLADRVLVGGAIANPLFAARGIHVSTPPITDAETRALVRMLARSPKIVLPVDGVMGRSPGARQRTGPFGRMKRGEGIFDAGPSTVRLFRRELRNARTIIWNGPLGLVEMPAFQKGTLGLVRAIGQSRGRSIVGGGDTIAWLEERGLLKRFDYVSTGGGAMLAYLAGEKLPGLEALRGGKLRN